MQSVTFTFQSGNISLFHSHEALRVLVTLRESGA